MLKVKALVFVLDESYDENGILHMTELYNRKAMIMFLSNPMQSAEECIKENIKRTLSKIAEDVYITLKVESSNDIQYFYEKNMMSVMYGGVNNGKETDRETKKNAQRSRKETAGGISGGKNPRGEIQKA